jgi:hypothetical protein
MPTREQIEQTLKPRQTLQQRDISCDSECGPLWLRTCYLGELEEHYTKLAGDSGIGGGPQTTIYVVDDNRILDNKELYDISPDWPKLLLRLPKPTALSSHHLQAARGG